MCMLCCQALEDSYPYDGESFDQTTEGEDYEDESSIDRTAELENEVCNSLTLGAFICLVLCMVYLFVIGPIKVTAVLDGIECWLD